jgi:hypothetical protein
MNCQNIAGAIAVLSVIAIVVSILQYLIGDKDKTQNP